ncbi:hypothetical protein BX600DRAFT_34644 [Xylariales sp. PMI_506]|nr:hypothetical protein BX600DRAFT_34644 [Xylariales sp. PMI_506]
MDHCNYDEFTNVRSALNIRITIKERFPKYMQAQDAGFLRVPQKWLSRDYIRFMDSHVTGSNCVGDWQTYNLAPVKHQRNHIYEYSASPRRRAYIIHDVQMGNLEKRADYFQWGIQILRAREIMFDNYVHAGGQWSKIRAIGFRNIINPSAEYAVKYTLRKRGVCLGKSSRTVVQRGRKGWANLVNNQLIGGVERLFEERPVEVGGAYIHKVIIDYRHHGATREPTIHLICIIKHMYPQTGTKDQASGNWSPWSRFKMSLAS